MASLSAPHAFAQGNYQSTPVGGRSALMGNTGVALGRDGAAPVLNPATIVRINDKDLAFSMNFYSYNWTSLGKWHQPGQADQTRFPNLSLPDKNLVNTSFNTLPSTLCVFFTIGKVGDEDHDKAGPKRRGKRQKLGVCAANVERSDFGFQADAYRGASGPLTSNQTQSLNRSWQRLLVGPTYAIDINERLSLGATLHGIVSTYHSDWAVTGITYDPAFKGITSSFTKSIRGVSVDLGAILGATYRVRHDTVGVAVHLLSFHIFGNSASTYYSSLSGAAGDTTTTSGASSGSLTAPSPPRIAAAWGREFEKGMIEADLTFAFPLDDAITAHLSGREWNIAGGTVTETPFDGTIRENYRGTISANVGGEWYFRPTLSILGGISTELSAVPLLQGNGTNFTSFTQARTNRASLSIGLGTHGDGGELMFGAQLTRGWGQMFAVNPYQVPPVLDIVDQSNFGALFVIAGTTSLRTIQNVVEGVGNVVAPSSVAAPQPSTVRANERAQEPKTEPEPEPEPEPPPPASPSAAGGPAAPEPSAPKKPATDGGVPPP